MQVSFDLIIDGVRSVFAAEAQKLPAGDEKPPGPVEQTQKPLLFKSGQAGLQKIAIASRAIVCATGRYQYFFIPRI